jgi:hypothetical protein
MLKPNESLKAHHHDRGVSSQGWNERQKILPVNQLPTIKNNLEVSRY